MGMRRITRRDVALGRVPPKTIENGVVSPPCAQINAETLAEHQARRRQLGEPPLTREQALEHYGADEVDEVFGSGGDEPAGCRPGSLVALRPDEVAVDFSMFKTKGIPHD